MTELEMKTEDVSEDFAGDLSDEALDRAEEASPASLRACGCGAACWLRLRVLAAS